MPQTPSQVLRSCVKNLAPRFDIEAFEVAIACVKAQDGDGYPVWLNIHAPPSSGKTVILDAFPTRKLPEACDPVIKDGILFLDSLTPRTLISGLANFQKPGLLERIESCSLLIKDLAPLAANNDAREIFSQLRRVFDGELSMPFGSGKSFSWSGRLTVVCASVSHLSSMDAELGARLLSISLRPIEFSQKLTENKKALRSAVGLVLSLTPKPHVESNMYQMARSYARAIAIARAYIHRDWHEREMHDPPVEEQPHRLTNQLAALISGLCAMRGCKPNETRSTIERVAIESIPPYRRLVLSVMGNNANGIAFPALITEAQARSKIYRASDSSLRRTVEDLCILRLLDDDKVATILTATGRPPKLIEPGSRWHQLDCIRDSLKRYK